MINQMVSFLKTMIKRYAGLVKMYQLSVAFFYRTRYLLKISKKRKSLNSQNYKEFKFQGHETFFGYYDKIPVNKKELKIAYHAINCPTFLKPKPNVKLKIIVEDLQTNEKTVVGESKAYNWQQGTRLQWISNEEIVYNDFCEDQKRYILKRYNVSHQKHVRNYNLPIQETLDDKLFFSLNYQRIRTLREDYGYYNLPKLSDSQLLEKEQDGLWEVNYDNGNSRLLFSILDVEKINQNKTYDEYLHWFNHVMLSPCKSKFVFLHRCRKNHDKKDRLFLYDLKRKELKLILNYSIISHFNWLAADQLICFFKGEDAILSYKKINVSNQNIEIQDFFGPFNTFDGHPSISNGLLSTDTYPNNLGFQKLIVAKKNMTRVLGEFYHPIKFFRETRCDLHPKLYNQKIYFDQVNKSKRYASFITIKDLKNAF